jgi:hypothetical protein
MAQLKLVTPTLDTERTTPIRTRKVAANVQMKLSLLGVAVALAAAKLQGAPEAWCLRVKLHIAHQRLGGASVAGSIARHEIRDTLQHAGLDRPVRDELEPQFVRDRVAVGAPLSGVSLSKASKGVGEARRAQGLIRALSGVLELNVSHLGRRFEALVASVFREVDDASPARVASKSPASSLETPSMATATSVA